MFTSANVSNLKEKKKECLIIIFYVWTRVWCFTVYKALPVYTSTQRSLKPPWEVGGTQIIFQQLVIPCSCHAVSCLCDFTCALPKSWNVVFSSPCLIFHPVNSWSALKISVAAASSQILWKPPVWCRCFPSVCFLYLVQCSTDHMPLSWSVCFLSLTRLCAHLIAWVLSYLPGTVPVTQ